MLSALFRCMRGLRVSLCARHFLCDQAELLTQAKAELDAKTNEMEKSHAAALQSLQGERRLGSICRRSMHG
eukprot:3587314-Pleurochrysis_carterae.AAC.1